MGEWMGDSVDKSETAGVCCLYHCTVSIAFMEQLLLVGIPFLMITCLRGSVVQWNRSTCQRALRKTQGSLKRLTWSTVILSIAQAIVDISEERICTGKLSHRNTRVAGAEALQGD